MIVMKNIKTISQQELAVASQKFVSRILLSYL